MVLQSGCITTLTLTLTYNIRTLELAFRKESPVPSMYASPPRCVHPHIDEIAMKAHETFILRELEVGLDHKQLYIALAIIACFRAIPLHYHHCPLIPGILLSVEAAFLNFAPATSRECDRV
eukprot:scaffold10550_cov271-Chaetoceros_neogracile.AAC.56